MNDVFKDPYLPTRAKAHYNTRIAHSYTGYASVMPIATCITSWYGCLPTMCTIVNTQLQKVTLSI